MLYADPGSGSLLLQFLLAAIAGGLFAARRFVAGTIAWLRGRKRKPEPRE